MRERTLGRSNFYDVDSKKLWSVDSLEEETDIMGRDSAKRQMYKGMKCEWLRT